MLGNMYSTYLHYVKWTGSFQYGVTCAWKPVAFYNRCWGNVLDRDIDSKVICKHKHWKYQREKKCLGGIGYGLPKIYNSAHACARTHTHTTTRKHSSTELYFVSQYSYSLSLLFILKYGENKGGVRQTEVIT